MTEEVVGRWSGVRRGIYRRRSARLPGDSTEDRTEADGGECEDEVGRGQALVLVLSCLAVACLGLGPLSRCLPKNPNCGIPLKGHNHRVESVASVRTARRWPRVGQHDQALDVVSGQDTATLTGIKGPFRGASVGRQILASGVGGATRSALDVVSGRHRYPSGHTDQIGPWLQSGRPNPASDGDNTTSCGRWPAARKHSTILTGRKIGLIPSHSARTGKTWPRMGTTRSSCGRWSAARHCTLHRA